ncbi:MAG: DNA polymerase III subunit beta [Thermoanaerobacterales bacterium 50_218]|nr:MAG: DNA polymerase III subunit beta [Thermoanaerobacterales bacterium 50_218]HAA89710.1 DNA polymerase III subunit beta [Peptococcaceae bacterium]
MLIKCQQSELSPALSAVCKIVPTRTTIPVLKGCLCSAEKGKFCVEVTDLESGLKIQIPAETEKEGKTVVEARYLAELIRRLPDTEVTLSFDEEAQQLVISCGRSCYRLNTWPVEDYPPFSLLASEGKYKIVGSKFKSFLKRLLFAVAPQDIRPGYSGVYFHFKGNVLNIVATDTYRLALLEVENEEFLEDEIFVPAHVLGEINRILNDEDVMSISWNNGMATFQTPYFNFTTRLLETKFPNYQQVIPLTSQLQVKVNRLELMAALERASLFVSSPDHKQSSITQLVVDEQSIYITAVSSHIGSLYEEVSLLDTSGGKCEAAFNTRFLLEPLRVMESEAIVLNLNGADGPAVYHEEEVGSYFHLVLPVRPVS